MKDYSHMLSNREFKARIARKTNSEIVETIELASQENAWKPIAKILSNSSRQYSAINLKEIDAKTKEGDIVIVLGKILATGDLTKRIRLCALSISEPAREKLKKTKSEFVTIKQEIQINKKASGIKILD